MVYRNTSLIIIEAKRKSLQSGETTVIEDASTDKIYVKLDIKLSDEALQDSISIDISDDDGVYTIAVNVNSKEQLFFFFIVLNYDYVVGWK